MNTATHNPTKKTTKKTMNDTPKSADNDVIDVQATEEQTSEQQGDTGDWAERAPLTSAFLRKFDAARNALTEQLEAGQKNIDELQKKAIDLVGQVQQRAGKVGEKVTEQGKEASTRLEALRKNLGGKFPLRIDLESWLNLPLEAREEVLNALGIASDRQVRQLHDTIEKMREETIVLVEAQTAVLKEIIEANGTKATTARKTTTRKPAAAAKTTSKAAATKAATARKTTARKTTARKTTARKATTKAKTEIAEA